MLRQLATNILFLAIAAAGPVACTGSGDSPADPGGSSVASGSGGAAPAGGQTSATSGAGGDGAAGGNPDGTGGADPDGTGGADPGGAGGADPGGTGTGGAETGCLAMGGITYALATVPTPTAEQQSAYDMITSAMDEALSYYNCHTSIEKSLRVSYEPSIATADGNVNGSIRFGAFSSMNHITAMHEIAHTVGVGSREFGALVVDGIFTGAEATSQLRAITGNDADVVHADAQHFWPYGLNYTSEVKTTDDLVNHCKIVAAIREDIGL
ncbi:hypothetical protein [Sorangium sp. So ce233]|uniref:hypothetical protein n=1 Tax=Sorangium sp. So ce233 TaxID=3133290 RepID=UPI003F63BCF0